VESARPKTLYHGVLEFGEVSRPSYPTQTVLPPPRRTAVPNARANGVGVADSQRFADDAAYVIFAQDRWIKSMHGYHGLASTVGGGSKDNCMGEG
jgi:hypothetical protein